MKIRNSIPALLVALPLASQAWFMPYPKPAGKYPQANASDSAAAHATLLTRWQAWKSLTGIANGTIAKDDYTGKRVSEGIGYGLLLSVMFNDQAAFKALWEAAEKKSWRVYNGNEGWYAWVTGDDGSPIRDTANNWAASDADEDIALAMIFASALVRVGKWTPMTYTGTVSGFPNTGSSNVSYTIEQKARFVKTSIENYMISQPGTAFPLGANHFCHASMLYQLKDASNNAVILYNPSYFSPAWYRVFQDFGQTVGDLPGSINWATVIDNGYAMIQGQPNASRGMVRDWSNEKGGQVKMGFFSGSLFGHVNDMYYDGIRAPYRLGVDAIWFDDANAKKYVTSAASSAGDPSLWGNLDGSPTKINDGSTEMATAMWGAAAAGGAAKGVSAASTALASNWNAWKSQNPGGYFKGALSLLGGLVMSGNFPNVWADLKASFPDTSTKITTALKALPDSIDAGGSTRLTATASKAVKWRIKYKAQSTGAAGTWTLMVGAATKTTMDTTFTFKNATLVGQTYDVKAYWDGGKDTSRTTIKVKGSASVLRSIRQDLVIRAGKQLSIQVPGVSAGSVQVRILDLSGRETRSFHAVPSQGQVEISMDNLGRGTQMIEIIDGTTVHRGLVPVIR